MSVAKSHDTDFCIILIARFLNELKMIYLAPLQGFTDFVYRKAYAGVFNGIDKYFIPYISVNNTGLLPKYEKEIRAENNLYGNAVPQILVKDADEMNYLVSILKNYGYHEINLNLGCPYPMVTNRGRGSGLLTDAQKVKEILSAFFESFSIKLSVKMRAGFDLPNQLEQIIPVLNDFPVSEVILHPRIASQLYKGSIYESAFEFASENLDHSLVFNGDINSIEDFNHRSKQFSQVSDWMIGRGVLKNVFLPSQIKGQHFSEFEKRTLLQNFNELVAASYIQNMDNEGNAANKISQFWSYFCYHFNDPKKQLKRIKKAKKLDAIKRVTTDILIHEPLQQNGSI